MKTAERFNDIDGYILSQPAAIRKQLEEMRQIILSAAPKSAEVISYNMPAFKINSVIVYFAGYRHHIGFYPTGSGIKAFEKDLQGYKYSKGAVQFPLDKKLPAALIKRIVKFKVKEDAEKAKLKRKT